MTVDENVFFREATLRICGSSNIETALKHCFEYIRAFIPVIKASLHTVDYDSDILQVLASVGGKQLEGHARVLPLPEKGRNKRAADLQAALSKNEVLIIVVNQPDQEEGLPEILERFGLKSDVSVMIMYLKLENNLIGIVGLAADGLNQYDNEHARLLKLLQEPFAIAMSNALRHQETIRFKDELMSHLRFFQKMDRINRAMQRTSDLEQMMSDVLDAILSIFDCDRAHLLYPCDPDAPSFEAVMERTRPEYPGRRGAIPKSPDSAKNFQLILASSGALTFGPETDFGARFGQKSQIMIALHPKTGKPWVLGMHQCSYPRVWTEDERKLLEEIARRMTDVLTGLLAHRDLHESGERYRVILQTAMDGFFRTDMQGRIIEVNETYCRMSGYTEQELLTMDIGDIEAEHGAEMIAANIRKTVELGPNRFESVHRRKDGSLFDVEISAQYQPIAGRQTVVFVRDITERKRAEGTLRLASIYNRSLIEASLDPLVTIDPEGRISDVNAATEQVSGYSREQLVGTDFSDYFTDPEKARAGYQRVFDQGFVRDYELEIRNRNGDTTPVLYNASVYRDDTGNVIGVFAAARDITKQKCAEESLRRIAAYLAETQRLTHTGTFVGDDTTKPLYWSEELFRIFGFDPQHGLPMRDEPLQRIHPQDLDKFLQAFQRTIQQKVDSDVEYRIVLPDGTVKHVYGLGHPVLDANGELVEVVGTTVDITERKRAEEALRRSEAYLAEGQRLSRTGSWSWSPATGRLLYCSEEMFRIYGLNPQEGAPAAEAFLQRIHPEDLDRTYELMMKAAAVAMEYAHEHRIVLPNGTIKHIHAIGRPVLDENGQIDEYVGTEMDITDRKCAEEALRRSETYLAEAQRLSHTGSWSFDFSTKEYIYASEEDFRLWGFDPQRPLPTREAVFQRIHPDDRDRMEKSRDRLIREKTDTSIEFRIVMPNGAVKHIHTIQHPVVNDAGDVVQMVGTSMDITERKRAEEALRRSETYLAEAQRLSHTGSWAFDVPSNGYIYFSEECSRIFELDAQKGIPNREAISRLIHPEDWDRVNEDFEELLRKKVDSSSEFRVVLPSGTRKHIQVIRHPVLNAAGDVVTILGTAIDITERKKTEAEINSLKNYLSNIIDSMPSILVGMDNSLNVTQWNRQAEAFTGIPAEEAIGKPIVHLLPDFATWITIMGADMDEDRPSSMEKLLIEKEGERRFYDLMLYRLIVDSVEGAVLRIEDVTERARIQELMVQTEKMMSIGGLAAGMAHEINNPLGIITQAAQNIERRISVELPANRKVSEELGLNLEMICAYFEKRQIPDAVASIRTASSRAAKIVTNMLQFSRRADTTTEPASLAQVVDQSLELAASDYDLKKKYDFRGIEIIKEYQDAPKVPMVSVEIEQVILNLLKNAAQAMTANPPDRKPQIALRLRPEGRYAVLEVEDNGPGMTEDIRRRVFEPFFTTKEPGVGTGLGLSVSYIIVTQNHKGLIEVESTPGSGTLFKVRLPIMESKT